MDEKQILVSIGDDKIKEIAEVIGNKTCNKILDLLVENEMTTTEISKSLKIPLNTIDYDVKKLVKSGLIETSSKWWSVKGKKINSYKISNKKIVISPKKSVSKIFASTILLTGIGALLIKKLTSQVAISRIEEPMMLSVYDTAVQESGVVITQVSQGIFASITPTWWFLFGAWTAILIFFTFSIIEGHLKRPIIKFPKKIERRKK